MITKWIYFAIFNLLSTYSPCAHSGRDQEYVNKLVHLIDEYLDSVNDYLGHGFIRSINKRLNKEKYRYTMTKIQRLGDLKRELTEEAVKNDDLLLAIVDYLSPYQDPAGSLFLEKARDLILKMNNSPIIERHSCTICFERRTQFVAFNCGHASMCKQCFKRGNFKKCPFCRARISKVHQVTKCVLCQSQFATTSHKGCRHLDTCEVCQRERSKTVCMLCNDDGEHNTLKLYH